MAQSPIVISTGWCWTDIECFEGDSYENKPFLYVRVSVQIDEPGEISVTDNLSSSSLFICGELHDSLFLFVDNFPIPLFLFADNFLIPLFLFADSFLIPLFLFVDSFPIP